MTNQERYAEIKRNPRYIVTAYGRGTSHYMVSLGRYTTGSGQPVPVAMFDTKAEAEKWAAAAV